MLMHANNLAVVQAPNPILRSKTKPVKKITPDCLKLSRDMIKLTKTFIDPEGVGLAANQVGRDDCFFVAKQGKKFITCFNPKILSYGDKKKIFFEGCLSIPNYYAYIKRPTKVTVEYQDETGQTITKKLGGTAAWIFQHETDHLNGKLFMDLALEQKGRIFKVTGKDRAGADIFEEVEF